MKKNISKICFILAIVLLSIAFAWYVLNSLLLGLVFGILVLLFALYIQKKIKKRNIMFHNIDSAYNFVNLMNIQMLSTSSVYEAYKSIENYVDIDFANISNEDLHMQLSEIANYYNLNSFKMYVNVLQIYDSEGGNFKEMQEIPTSLCQKTKIYYHKLSKSKFFKLVEISTLFLLWVSIMIILKVSIPDYYAKMLEDMKYQMLMLGIIVVGAFIYYLAFEEYLKNKIKGL